VKYIACSSEVINLITIRILKLLPNGLQYSVANYVRISTQILNKVTHRCGGPEDFGTKKQVLRNLLGTFISL
jgi:hypothetical protein